MSEIIISSKIIPPHLEKNTLPPNTSKDKKTDKQDELIQALFDYVIKDTCALVTLSSKTAKISKVIDPASLKALKPESDSSIINELIKSESNNLLRPMLKKSARQQREERLKK